MLMQGSAANWMNARLNDSFSNPSLDALIDSFKEYFFKAKELKWKQASAIWHEKQLLDEKVLHYVVRMKKVARQLDFQPEIVQMCIFKVFERD